MREKTVVIRYVGSDVVSVEGVGVFQSGTQAAVPRDHAYELLGSDEWIIPDKSSAALHVVLRVGQWEHSGDDDKAFLPENPEDFGDMTEPED